MTFDVDHFRYYVGNPSAWDHYDHAMSERMREAALEIERLRAALHTIAEVCPRDDVRHVARAAVTDIVERLEKRAAMVTPWATCCGEAADVIKRLRADNELLQTDRNKWREMWGELDARAALEPKP